MCKYVQHGHACYQYLTPAVLSHLTSHWGLKCYVLFTVSTEPALEYRVAEQSIYSIGKTIDHGTVSFLPSVTFSHHSYPTLPKKEE